MTTWPPFMAPLTAIWFESMVHACWQGSMVIALVWGLCRVLPQLSPSVRCWLWRLAYTKLLLSLIGLTPFSLPLLPMTDTTPTTAAGATQMTLSAPPSVQQSDSRPEPVSAAGPFETHLSPQFLDWGSLLACVWLIGVMLVGIRIVYDWHSGRRLRRSGTILDDATLISAYHRLCTQLGIATPPRLIVTEAVMSPALLGLFHPAILLPRPLLESYSQREYELILAHELAHVKHHDLLWRCLPACAHLLFFFHPLVWLAQREYRLAQEIACDAQVVLHPRISVAEYGRVLLAVASGASLCREHQRGQSTTCLFTSATEIKRRLIALAQVRKPSRIRLAVHVIVMVGLSLALLIPWRLTAQAMVSERPDTVRHEAPMPSPSREIARTADLTVETAVRTMLAAYNTADVTTFAQYLQPTVATLYSNDSQQRINFNASTLADAFRAGLKSHVLIDDLNIGGFRDTAFVTVKLSGTLTETTGVTHTGPWRLTQKWVRQDNAWKLSFYLGFPMLPWELVVRSDLQQVMRQYWQATVAGNADTVTALFAPEAQVIFSTSPTPINGRDAIQQAYAQWFRDFPRIRIERLEFAQQSGDDAVAVTYASYTIVETNRAGHTQRRKERVTLAHVNTHGEWLIVSQHHSPHLSTVRTVFQRGSRMRVSIL